MNIYNAIKNYTDKHTYPFHMPGHKRNTALWDKLMPASLAELDVTELGGLDNLHSPKGVIREAEKRIASIYGAQDSYLLVNGATAGVLAAIGSVCAPGELLLAGRGSHRSLHGGLVFSGASPVYIMPEMTDYGLFGGYEAKKIKKALAENDSIKAVFITSPTYEGFVSDIGRIADIVHSAGKILIVDEAHGAHFVFDSSFPITAVQCGADIVIHGLHKTMPVPNQSALLHISGNRVDRRKLSETLSLLQTTSPSYILMAAMERVITFFTENNMYFTRYTDELRKLRCELSANKRIELITKGVVGSASIFDLDIGKLALYIPPYNISGASLYTVLAEEYGLQLEMSGPRHVLAMTSVADDFSAYGKLAKAIEHIASKLTDVCETPVAWAGIPDCKMEITPREAYYMTKRSVDIRKASGCISGSTLTPYPPGAPLIMPGEMITDEIIKMIIYYKEGGVTFLETEDYEISILK